MDGETEFLNSHAQAQTAESTFQHWRPDHDLFMLELRAKERMLAF